MTATGKRASSSVRDNHRGRHESRRTPFLEDLGMCLANLAFFPLSYFTLLPEVRRDILGLGEGLMIDGPLHIALFVSAWATLALAKGRKHGRLAHAGIIFNIIIFCLMIPIVFLFAAMIFVGFAIRGPEVLLFFWKGVLYFGFLAYCFLGDHDGTGSREAEETMVCNGKVASGMRCRFCRGDNEYRERSYFPSGASSPIWPMRRWVRFVNRSGWRGRWY